MHQIQLPPLNSIKDIGDSVVSITLMVLLRLVLVSNIMSAYRYSIVDVG